MKYIEAGFGKDILSEKFARKIATSKEISSALDTFFRRPYWKRVWILQEVIAGKNVTAYCGTKSIRMDRLELVLAEAIKGQELLSIPQVPHFDSFQKDPSTDMPRPLMELWMSSASSRATDPRDKIYALLGLSSDGQEIVPLPNYKQPLPVVFQDITLSILKSRGYIGLISLRSAPPTDGSPSWVPELANLSKVLRPWHSWVLDHQTPQYKLMWRMLDIDPRFANMVLPTHKELDKAPIEAQKGILKLKGAIHDVIDDISTGLPVGDTSTPAEYSWNKMVQPRSRRRAYEEDSEIAVAIASSLCMDSITMKSGNNNDEAEPMRMFKSYLASFYDIQTKKDRDTIQACNPKLQKLIDENRYFEIDGKRFGSWLKPTPVAAPNRNNILEFVPHAVNLMRGDDCDFQRLCWK
jgi:hypothetical protein